MQGQYAHGCALTQTKVHGRVLKERKCGQPARPLKSPELTQLLRDHHVEVMAARGATVDDPVWPGRGIRGKAWRSDMECTPSASALARRVDVVIERAELVDANGKRLVSLHDLRRTGASLAAEAGVPEVISVLHQLGHSTPNTTREHYYPSNRRGRAGPIC